MRHRGTDETEEAYRGVAVHAARGVHQKVVEIVRGKVAPGARVLDLGAGQGALSLRLHDAGFQVAAFDLDPSDWRVPQVPCHALDFDRDLGRIAEHAPFAAICAVEVIEHLENPRGFLRGLIQAVQAMPQAAPSPSEPSPSVWLILSTPNPLDTFSCISLFTRGIFNWFSVQHYEGGGHISILPHWMVGEHLKYLGAPDQEWHFVAPYEHPVAWKQGLYKTIGSLRKAASKSPDQSFFEGQTALVAVRLPLHSQDPQAPGATR